MTRQPPRLRAFFVILAWLTIASSPGRTQTPTAPAPAEPKSDGPKDHWHIFLVNGVDPLKFGNLSSLGRRLQEQGFSHTYYGELPSLPRFRETIRQVRRDDASARFALIGFSLGANRACELAQSLQPDGIRVDVAVFLSGNHWLGGLPAERPPNVGRVVNILASGALKNTGWRDWAENYQIRSALHFGTPNHAETLQLITEVLSNDTPAPANAETPTTK
jgi:hypothetical protein